jgi:hypothetical protein
MSARLRDLRRADHALIVTEVRGFRAQIDADGLVACAQTRRFGAELDARKFGQSAGVPRVIKGIARGGVRKRNAHDQRRNNERLWEL